MGEARPVVGGSVEQRPVGGVTNCWGNGERDYGNCRNGYDYQVHISMEEKTISTLQIVRKRGKILADTLVDGFRILA